MIPIQCAYLKRSHSECNAQEGLGGSPDTSSVGIGQAREQSFLHQTPRKHELTVIIQIR